MSGDLRRTEAKADGDRRGGNERDGEIGGDSRKVERVGADPRFEAEMEGDIARNTVSVRRHGEGGFPRTKCDFNGEVGRRHSVGADATCHGKVDDIGSF